MLSRIRLILFGLLFVTPVLAQPLKPGEWRTYTSMRTVRAMAVSNDHQWLWTATSGGLFHAHLTQNGLELDSIGYRTTDGLTENDLTSIATDSDGDTYIGG